MGEGWGENARQEKRQRFSADEPAARRLADLENTLRLIGLDASEYVPLIAPLVDIPLPEERAAKLAAEELGRRQLAALTAWLLTGARSQPVVLAFEDLHWADPTSLDLMQALSERGRPAQLFIIATARPEFRPPCIPYRRADRFPFQPRAGPGRQCPHKPWQSLFARLPALRPRIGTIETSSPSSFRSTQSSHRFRTDPGAPSATRKSP
jgi:hypothetical protein